MRPKQHEERQRRGRHQAAAPPGHGGGGAPAKEPVGAENAGGEAAPGEQPDAARLPRAMGVAALLSGARQWGFLWKALTVHSANLAAQLAARPLQPLQASRACAALAAAVDRAGLQGSCSLLVPQVEEFMLAGLCCCPRACAIGPPKPVHPVIPPGGLQDRLQRELANTAAVREACRQLQVWLAHRCGISTLLVLALTVPPLCWSAPAVHTRASEG